jgi:DNA-binding transcriptional ArsR family regulator
MLLLLAERGEASVGDLVEVAGQAQSTISGHLAMLRLAGVVAPRREGRRVYYRLSSPFAAELLRQVCDD